MGERETQGFTATCRVHLGLGRSLTLARVATETTCQRGTPTLCHPTHPAPHPTPRPPPRFPACLGTPLAFSWRRSWESLRRHDAPGAFRRSGAFRPLRRPGPDTCAFSSGFLFSSLPRLTRKPSVSQLQLSVWPPLRLPSPDSFFFLFF